MYIRARPAIMKAPIFQKFAESIIALPLSLAGIISARAEYAAPTSPPTPRFISDVDIMSASYILCSRRNNTVPMKYIARDVMRRILLPKRSASLPRAMAPIMNAREFIARTYIAMSGAMRYRDAGTIENRTPSRKNVADMIMKSFQ